MCILIVNKEIYFGARLDHLLINPNQIRHFEIPVSDNVYDSGRDFGIDPYDQFIPFKSEGSNVFFNSFMQTYAEINTCPHMVIIYSEI